MAHNQVVSAEYGGTKNILIGSTSNGISVQLLPAEAIEVNGKKYIKAGTILGTTSADPKLVRTTQLSVVTDDNKSTMILWGVLISDVEVTNYSETDSITASMVFRGVVDYAKLTNSEVLTDPKANKMDIQFRNGGE